MGGVSLLLCLNVGCVLAMLNFKFYCQRVSYVLMLLLYNKTTHTCIFSKSGGTLVSLCKGAFQEQLLELVLVTLWVRITWSEPPGT
jgi:hypothetical protein